ncbi:TIGR03086 family metal-binding protein [Gordonia hankookensis]|uniref:TIGR03086 family protein n=1 Tax=Gordonia hankookensis TaxID=589403 RepID=A0ABR7WCU3_9ACTN|nr:TIGR03086 family metal-binding protein [Gordonia hankookensis]MBD1319667.1 TIGR03086 family protein [Gordonia hankookensis]
MTSTTPADPRPAYGAATTWVTGLLAAVSDDQLTSPTPCEEFDVRTLAAHVIATAQRAIVLAEGGDVLAVPRFAETHDAESYAALVARAVELWSDDAKLGAMVRVPWGEVPGAGALWGYVSETLVHGWDLAVATGQPAEADPEFVGSVLAVAQQFIPAEIRGDAEVPFGPVVEPRPEAGPTERLANWTGRDATTWVRPTA